MKPLPVFEDPETKKLIESLTSKYDVDVPLLEDLCDVMQKYSGDGRKTGVNEEITDCLGEFMRRNKPNP
ncbi:MAG: hypothetical protein M2R45_05354 [Verrucomicrobia subdivision 3 bacterium]|nr:hypothetical protein [Limisphaerales bacterium]MCS1417782.1 hypothetical protein [Limisphaerales bacterium]